MGADVQANGPRRQARRSCGLRDIDFEFERRCGVDGLGDVHERRAQDLVRFARATVLTERGEVGVHLIDEVGHRLSGENRGPRYPWADQLIGRPGDTGGRRRYEKASAFHAKRCARAVPRETRDPAVVLRESDLCVSEQGSRIRLFSQ